MRKKSRRPPVDIEIQWTEDETNPGGKEPSKKLMAELARELGRMMARQHLAELEAKRRESEAKWRELSDACDELINSAIVKQSNTSKSDDK